MVPIANILSGEGKRWRLKHREAATKSLNIQANLTLFRAVTWKAKDSHKIRVKYTGMSYPTTSSIWALSLVKIYYTKHKHLERISNFSGEQDPRSHLRLNTHLLESCLHKDWVRIYLNTWWFSLWVSPTAFLPLFCTFCHIQYSFF